MKKYTAKQYEEFITEFTTEKPVYKTILCREIYYNRDLFSMNITEMKHFIVDEMLINSDNLRYLQIVRNALKIFYDWCVDKKILSVNVWCSEPYEYAVFADYKMDKMDLTVYYDEDIEDIVNSVPANENKPLFEMIIRAFYEGMDSMTNFVRVKKPDIDFDNNCIYFDCRKINISEKLSEAIKKYLSMEDYSVGNSKMVNYKDYLFKVKDDVAIGDDESYFLKVMDRNRRYVENISQFYGKKVNLKGISASGFINYVKKRCDAELRNQNYFLRIFEIGIYGRSENKKFMNLIVDYAMDFGYKKSQSNLLRIKYYPYVKKSKYYE